MASTSPKAITSSCNNHHQLHRSKSCSEWNGRAIGTVGSSFAAGLVSKGGNKGLEVAMRCIVTLWSVRSRSESFSIILILNSARFSWSLLTSNGELKDCLAAPATFFSACIALRPHCHYFFCCKITFGSSFSNYSPCLFPSV